MNKETGKQVLKASGALALAGLCATGVASGIACPILMGAAGTLAFSAMRRKNDVTSTCAVPVVKDEAARR